MTGASRSRFILSLFTLAIFLWVPIASALTGVVKTDGALIYSKPDFDAEVLTTLAVGQKVVVSKGTTGEYAKFHRVRSGPIVGYIAEIDVSVEGSESKASKSANATSKSKSSSKNKNEKSKLKSGQKSDQKSGQRSKSAKSQKADRAQAATEAQQRIDDERRRQERAALPFAFNRYVGLVVGAAGYEDEIGGSKKKESLLVYGLKVTGPDIFFQGPIIDLNVLLHYGAPKGYEAISRTKPSGFFILADPLLLLPLFQREKMLGSLGVGPALSYRSFKTVDASGFVSHSGFGVGLSLQASAGLRLGDYALRLEGKYLVDKRVDTIFQLSLQNAF